MKHDKQYLSYLKEEKELHGLFDGLEKVYRKEFKKDQKQLSMYVKLPVHRLVAEYVCNRPSALHQQVTHLNHNKLSNHTGNLRCITQEELTVHHKTNPNMKKQRSIRKGRRYENSKSYKLTSTKVMLIKKRLNEGKSLSILAKQFKVTMTQLSRIKSGINRNDIQAAR